MTAAYVCTQAIGHRAHRAGRGLVRQQPDMRHVYCLVALNMERGTWTDYKHLLSH